MFNKKTKRSNSNVTPKAERPFKLSTILQQPFVRLMFY
jgi:hypothetical protein